MQPASWVCVLAAWWRLAAAEVFWGWKVRNFVLLKKESVGRSLRRWQHSGSWLRSWRLGSVRSPLAIIDQQNHRAIGMWPIHMEEHSQNQQFMLACWTQRCTWDDSSAANEWFTQSHLRVHYLGTLLHLGWLTTRERSDSRGAPR